VSGDESGGGTWTFDGAGNLTFPDATVQNTAWTGNANISSLVNGAYTASLGAGGEFTLPGNITLPNSAVIKDTVGYAVAFGRFAGAVTQGLHAVAIGDTAGYTGQVAGAVAIGWQAGEDSQGGSAVAIGSAAGRTSQGQWAVAVGSEVGQTTQGQAAVAVGTAAGTTSQGVAAVGVGFGAGSNTQGTFSVAIGSSAGSNTQGSNAVAIGARAGFTTQGNNSIILNATGANLDQTTANTFTVAPVRNDVANIAEVMFYNTTSKEVTYGNTLSVTGNVSVGGNLTATGGIRKSARVLTTTTTLTVADASGFIEFSPGSGPYTITLPNPTLAANSGIGYRFWQNTTDNITLSTPAGAFYGPSGSTTSTKVLAQATTQYWDVWSDGFNWAVFGIKIA
jgi:hypothetical protein